ncbi:unnamed protein product [Prorocentrum cordatum]|uniref:Uncharacterized protein n=1 Tax=Prorocentrum cordatum TaxID=2364126 RepID=A0ABN9RW43_9DINO|nr:unnamed protein product [Polarella glacialis]
MHERDQLYGHGVKVSQSKLRRLRAKRVRYRLWSTARGPDPSCLVRAGIFAPRYYRNFCSDDSEEEEWVEDTCGTQTDMDAVELAGNSLCSQCSECGTQTDPCVHIECGTQTDLCVLSVGEEEKECHRVRADPGDASAVGSSCAVGGSTVRSAVGSSTVRSSADAVVDAVVSSTAGSSAVLSTAVWSSADAVASNPGCKDEEEENVHSEAVAKMEQEEVAEEDFVHAFFLAYSDSNVTKSSTLGSAVGSSALGSAVGSSTVRSSADAVEDAVGSSTAGSSAVGSSADAVGSSMNGSSADRPSETRSECQAARDWARAGVDVRALWLELHRLPTQELQRRIEALNAYRLQLGIESSEEDHSQQGGPQSSTSRSALTRSGKKHRKRHR